MKRPKVTGGDGRFDIPPTQRTRCCHKFCDPGQESTKEDLPGGGSFSAHHMYACCVLIANNMANLILLTECVFCGLYLPFIGLIFWVFCHSQNAQLRSHKSVLRPETCPALTHTEFRISGPSPSPGSIFLTIHFHANGTRAKTVRHRKSNYL